MNWILNDDQRKLVEDNLDLIDRVIKKKFRFDETVLGLEYDDLYQVGAMGLCKAAAHYQAVPGAKFETYAYQVVKNTILDHMRNVLRRRDAYTLYLQDKSHSMLKPHTLDQALGEKITLQALDDSKGRYSASVRTGIEAISLKAQGYNGVDIAEQFGVKENYIAACISRARKYLQKDKAFLKMIR